MKTKLAIATLMFSLIFIFSACGENIVESTPVIDDNNNSSVKANFASIQTEVLGKSCAVSGCHVAGVVSPNLSSGAAFGNIVNKASTQTLNYIEPGNADQSYLYRKITGASGINGLRMPRSRAPLAQATIDSIRVWINNGAQNN